MLSINAIHNINIEPASNIDSIDVLLALKNNVLFGLIDDEICICLNEQKLDEALSFLAKYDLTYQIVFLDEDSYDRLYGKFLEIKTDKELSGLPEEDQEDNEDEDSEFSITELLQTGSDLLDNEASAPIIKFVNSLFYQAIKRNASDIHIECHENKGVIRFRIDGSLVRYVDLEARIIYLVVSRIKVISNLDISEKRVSQDGRTQVKIAKKTLDIRVSILPTFYGERVVMRILMESEDIPHMQDLGFAADLTEKFTKLLKNSHGIILVTGPTGSGKSTTLHAFLQMVSNAENNIITVEDPVEYKADNINQVQSNEKVGLTFSSALRSILRQDPDIIMIGEIRDKETASIAIQASLTGHLVFSTLHTNNATASITRLIDMGIEEFLVSSAILGVFAQRLVRKLCSQCKLEDSLGEQYAEEFKLDKTCIIYKSAGCKTCNYMGYEGRIAIGELFEMTEPTQKLLKTHPSDQELRSFAIASGMITLQQRLIELINQGQTSVDEAIRIGLRSV